ncbi:MAG: hypothetical protein ACK5LK_05735 [Chthoniobacterales bacterium]
MTSASSLPLTKIKRSHFFAFLELADLAAIAPLHAMPPQNMQQNSTDKEIQATIVCEVVVAEIMPVVGEGIDLFMTDLGLEYVACGIEEAKASGRGFDSYLKMNLSPIFSIGDEDNVVRRWDIKMSL